VSVRSPTERGALKHRTITSPNRRKNRFIVVTDAAKSGLVYECWTTTERVALSMGRFRQWATSPSHEGLRRVLRPSEPYPVLDEEANYLVVAREQAGKDARETALVAALKQRDPQRRADREAAEDAAYAARLVMMRADQADRRVRRAALDARLGVRRPISDLPIQDPDTGEWI
jgi:hypothetical protein